MTDTAAYLADAIAAFDRDPPDTDFQRGFLEALKTVRDEALPSWQPIDTAPKDATSLFLIDGIGDPRAGKWSKPGGFWADLHSGLAMPQPMAWLAVPALSSLPQGKDPRA